MEQLIIENGIITQHLDAPELLENAVKVEHFLGMVGSYADEYDEKWHLKPLKERVKMGRAIIPPQMKLSKDGSALEKKTDVEQMIDGDIEIPKGFRLSDDKKSIVQRTLMESVLAKELTLDEAKALLVTQAKAAATAAIYKTYPDYAQTNMLSDHTFNVNIIAFEMEKSTDKVNAEIYTFIAKLSTVDDFVKFRSKIEKLNVSQLVGDHPDQSGLTNAYRTLIWGLVGRKLISFVRSWCNSKVNTINKCHVSDLDDITFTDHPEI